MKIINNEINIKMAEVSRKPCVGFFSGLVKVILAIVQIVPNALIALTTSIPSANGRIKKDSPFHTTQAINDVHIGCWHFVRGIH